MMMIAESLGVLHLNSTMNLTECNLRNWSRSGLISTGILTEDLVEVFVVKTQNHAILMVNGITSVKCEWSLMKTRFDDTQPQLVVRFECGEAVEEQEDMVIPNLMENVMESTMGDERIRGLEFVAQNQGMRQVACELKITIESASSKFLLDRNVNTESGMLSKS